MMTSVIKKLSAYILALRAGILFTVIPPVILGSAVAFGKSGNFSQVMFIAIAAGFSFINLGTNALNDYYDDMNGTDRVNNSFISPYTGGSRMLQEGRLSRKEMLAEAVVLFFISAVLLAYASVHSALVVPALSVFGMLSGIFYSAPPLKLSRTGAGEMLLALNLGPVIAAASCAAQGGALYPVFFLVFLPPGLLTAAFAVTAEIPDHYADKKTGKKTLLVRFGKEAGPYIHALFAFSAYVIIAAGIISGFIPAGAWPALSGAAISLTAIILTAKKNAGPGRIKFACLAALAAQFVSTILLAAGFAAVVPV